MKYVFLPILVLSFATTAFAKSWRVNNNAGVVADFISFNAAASSASVQNGDTIYVEPSVTAYAGSGLVLSKKLIVIGPGYFLNPSSTTKPGNGGLQAVPIEAVLPYIYFAAGANGSKFLGITLDGIYMRGTSNITFERVRFVGNLNFDNGVSTNITVRKCYFDGQSVNYSSGASASGFVFENNIINTGSMNLPMLTGSGNIVRNNSFYNTGTQLTVVSAYFVNNIVDYGNQCTLTDCTIKNNLFRVNQALPPTATNNLVSQNMADVFEGTGSYDGRIALKSTSPAKGAGLTVGAVVTPDCGAFGGPDPYKLSGIPNVPSIYEFTAPTSIPSGSATMNVTFSTRNNN